ncbi:methyltransferase [Bacillus cereus]|uniref:methyltransferase n=1 Tax=Bacillus cereus TaxID=1396 RepID=UPI003D98548B
MFDLPHVLEIINGKITDSNLFKSIKTHSGNFFNEELPRGTDTIVLSMILHNWSTKENRKILQNCYDALTNIGEFLISERMVDDDKTGLVFAALMSINMLIEPTLGKNYT